jgi:hypothetical protein
MSDHAMIVSQDSYILMLYELLHGYYHPVLCLMGDFAGGRVCGKL